MEFVWSDLGNKERAAWSCCHGEIQYNLENVSLQILKSWF